MKEESWEPELVLTICKLSQRPGIRILRLDKCREVRTEKKLYEPEQEEELEINWVNKSDQILP